METSTTCFRLTIDTALLPDEHGRVKPRPVRPKPPWWHSDSNVIAFFSLSVVLWTAFILWPLNG
jgi:hypothetical protein